MTSDELKKYGNHLFLRVDLNSPEWTLAWANQWRPMLKRQRKNLEWLLDVAFATAHGAGLADESAAVERIRVVLRRLLKGEDVRVSQRDLGLAFALVLTALERDLGSVATRPRVRFRRDTTPELATKAAYHLATRRST